MLSQNIVSAYCLTKKFCEKEIGWSMAALNGVESNSSVSSNQPVPSVNNLDDSVQEEVGRDLPQCDPEDQAADEGSDGSSTASDDDFTGSDFADSFSLLMKRLPLSHASLLLNKDPADAAVEDSARVISVFDFHCLQTPGLQTPDLPESETRHDICRLPGEP